MNVLITGRTGSGKTTLIRRLVETLGWRFSGYCTLPYQIGGEQRGFYLHSFSDIPGQLNDLPISVLQAPKTSVRVGETFRSLGTKCLQQALYSPSDCIILDEIGRFEQSETDFLDTIRAVLDQKCRPVLAAIKKEPIPFILEIMARQDCFHIDIDIMDREKAYQMLLSMFKIS